MTASNASTGDNANSTIPGCCLITASALVARTRSISLPAMRSACHDTGPVNPLLRLSRLPRVGVFPRGGTCGWGGWPVGPDESRCGRVALRDPIGVSPGVFAGGPAGIATAGRRNWKHETLGSSVICVWSARPTGCHRSARIAVTA
ncbi:hypothetical protein C3473_02120 [Mycobacterium kansasii]|nr:hypothetical protein C3475_01835 [Mycobacterium kansasii]POX83598.1 hypothetical protein C3471_00535 [Mycobacterium kansasii]POX86797.1 hypothetical protein C3470_02000 [Mycobacterium kansasii]POX97437.1 hypothetical protein C3473_02120 [Mycobacterium kansasii]POY13854.1 hypothetical protein C3474_02220 [Mycobacterium kansasii]